MEIRRTNRGAGSRSNDIQRDAEVMAWRGLGACRGLDPGVFYPETDEEAEVAKAVCGECDVRLTCLEHALAHREKQGVWGGATERERRRIIRQRRRTA
jgi:WhiB family transcriptional regulator, redox-sensing transcriptional regulator